MNPNDSDAIPKPFTFDGAYDVDSTTEQIYNEVVFPIVEVSNRAIICHLLLVINLPQSVIEGYNGTVFAYGQTGCGKSFTMQGIGSPSSQKGIIPRQVDTDQVDF